MNIARMGLKARLGIAGGFALVVVAALIGWGASQQADYKRQAENHAAENARHADYDVRYRCVPLTPLAERNCTIDRRREQRNYEREEQDLYAQKTAAFWTFLMGSAAIIGMVLSAVGVFLVFFTFGETRRANVLNMRENARSTRRAVASASETAAALAAANKSAEAAAGQVKIARDTAYRQLRAYLSIERVTAHVATKGIISCKIVLKNAGQTPATIKLFVNQWIGAIGGGVPEKAPPPYHFDQHNPFINANSEETIEFFYPLTSYSGLSDADAERNITAVIATKDPLFLFILYGRVEFVDFRKRRRILNFAYRSNGAVRLEEPIEFMALITGNSYEDRGEEA